MVWLVGPVATLLVLLATAWGGSPVSVEPGEREEALRRLTPTCRKYYDARARCVAWEGLTPERARQVLDEELGGLVVLSFDAGAERKCARELQKLRDRCPSP
jgi:hypothetical protein